MDIRAHPAMASLADDNATYIAPMDGTTPTDGPDGLVGTDRDSPARRLGGALEPVIGQVYFSPECHAAYQQLGFAGSSGEMKGVALPDGPAYFSSRGSLLGQVPGQVVAAAFGVFNPDVVVPSVRHGWSVTDATTICAARDRGALAQLDRLLGDEPAGLARVEELLRRTTSAMAPAGRPLAAGLMALAEPDHRFGAVFRLGDRLREFRGDSHTAAWVGAGFSAIEIGLLTELYWGLPLRSYSRSRGWTDDQFDGAQARLESAGLVKNGSFTERGRAARERVEADTDAQMVPVMAALGDDVEELISLLQAWGVTIRAGKGYPESGPHDLAARSTAADPRD